MAKKRMMEKNKPESSRHYSSRREEKIRKRAYYIWKRKGEPFNSNFEDWIEAEEELKSEGII